MAFARWGGAACAQWLINRICLYREVAHDVHLSRKPGQIARPFHDRFAPERPKAACERQAGNRPDLKFGPGKATGVRIRLIGDAR